MKQQTKKLLSLLLTLVMVVGLLPMTVFAATDGEEVAIESANVTLVNFKVGNKLSDVILKHGIRGQIGLSNTGRNPQFSNRILLRMFTFENYIRKFISDFKVD